MDSVSNIQKLNAMNVGAVQGAGTGVPATGAADGATGASFKDVLMQNLQEVSALQQDADTKLENFTSGKTANVGEVISASQKASLAFSMLVQIRNKLQDAYDEVKNLKV